MAYVMRIICLAASRKHLGYCYAGIDAQLGRWIRPVSDRVGHEISDFERTTLQGQRATVLDILNVSLVSANPYGFQSENHINDATRRWEKIGVATFDQIQPFVQPEAPLWIDGPSSYNGLNDQIPEVTAANLTTSLKLIRVQNLVLHVHSEGGVFAPAKRVVRAKFEYAGTPYWLKMTDPQLEAELKQRPDGEHAIPDAIMCISLGETFNGYAYKLVASVIIR